ncbi:d-4,5 unsaturated-glucuronyl hydrolase-like protein [Fomitiporia mediterranea MF3/22]|uniref:d-4,5 unsaturated-glucuronyl hydrolase-like protein n=1 Tax=Fomitiporia mediterranea (strain MF3/22) TaxID=694068 RepID=UPI0004407D47|nr:d-4,5 unsaturated-glucuronyl hydrolase-like protein [Fomitiporia mediterranea MF3/22]EJD01239.1 d-4,5 unsaturated-glucuronyl hydrolase-like protein [Fomitiporia mediterranea MF3/22]
MSFLTLLCLACLSSTSSLRTGVLAATPPSELFSPLIAQKISQIASNFSSPTLYPQYTDSSGKWLYFPTDTWTTGFFPALLYSLNTRASFCKTSSSNDGLNETDWLTLAWGWSAPEVGLETNNSVGHDVGFLSFPFQEELTLDSTNQSAVDSVNAFANDLAVRFDPTVGCTRSWDSSDPTDFMVIIDNMMDLDVLFVSANLTGNDTLRQIAISHADKTIENHVRNDGSSFHLVEYNQTTGSVIRRGTVQGYADNSTWSRGQSWGIYAFAQMEKKVERPAVYQNTGEQHYLDTSRRMATYFVTNIPSSGIVPWDFNAPDDGSRPADSSAATIASSALLLLSDTEQSLSPANSSGAAYWRDLAVQVLANTTASFWNPNWQSLLSNGTDNNRLDPPINDTGIIYGDYYFVQAGNQLLQAGLVNCSGSANSSALNNPNSSGPGPKNSYATYNTVPLHLQTLVLVLLCTLSFSLIL